MKNRQTNAVRISGIYFRRSYWRVLGAFALVTCFSFLQTICAVSPPPDGGYQNNNTAEGQDALFSLTSGFGNVAVGFDSLYYNTAGGDNTAIGSFALMFNQSGNDNTAVGYAALDNNKVGSNNTAAGEAALHFNVGGNDNTATGTAALFSNFGSQNTATGSQALFGNTGGADNTAVGFEALRNADADDNTALGALALNSDTTGADNTATGFQALFSNQAGYTNTASGVNALYSNKSGYYNTASGVSALFFNANGHDNLAEGYKALLHNTGSNNLGVGSNAGANLTTGSNNIDIGANVTGTAGEANTIRVGKQGTQRSTFVAGIFGTAVTGSTVVVNSTGKMGVATSSARFKEAIKPMAKTSEAILALNPVTFRYKEEIDPEGIPQFGLVAEEVEKVNPDLITRDEEGRPTTVRYEAVNAMLLNEFLKEHRTVAELNDITQKQQALIAQQQKQIEALTAGLQNVRAQVEMSRRALQVVSNRQ